MLGMHYLDILPIIKIQFPLPKFILVVNVHKLINEILLKL